MIQPALSMPKPTFQHVWLLSVLLSILLREVNGKILTHHGTTVGNLIPGTTCIPPPLTCKTWKDLNVDKFIQRYPDAPRISVQKFAAENGASNFLCGIGESCHAGPLCSPITSLDAWLVAYSIQQWSQFMKQCYNAVGYAFGATSSIILSMFIDLIPDQGKPRLAISWEYENTFFWEIVVLCTGAILSTSLLLVAAWTLSSAVAVMGLFAPVLQAEFLRRGREQDFESWSEVAFYISEAQGHIQNALAAGVKRILNNGISSSMGIFPLIQGGAFLGADLSGTESRVEINMSRMLKARVLSRVLRINNAYITRASDPCHFDGIAGARAGEHVLSYCDSQGILWEIVRAKGRQTKHKIQNANLIPNKYGFTVKEIVETSWHCQKKYGGFEHVVFNPEYLDPKTEFQPDGRWVEDMKDCWFNLPVCDCDIPGIHMARATHHKTTTQICRNIGQLPI